MSTDVSTEVLVIGGGIAGMVAANVAAQLGKSVLLIERGSEEKYPCNTRWTGGTFHVCHTDPFSGQENLLQAIDRTTGGTARKDVALALAEDSPRFIRWLRAESIRLISLGGYNTCVLAPPSRIGPGLHWEGLGGDVMLRTLEANLKKRGGHMQRGTRATALDRSGQDGIVVQTECDDKTANFRAQDVIIADGGFAGDFEMIASYITPHTKRVLRRNACTATGDGLRMALAAGAALSNGMENFYGHLLSRNAMENERLWPRPYLDALVTACIAVDGDGIRFADEGLGPNYMANAVARLKDPLGSFLVFDQAIWSGPGTSALIACNPHIPNCGGTMYKAQTITELAGMAGIPGANLQHVVDDYNQAVTAGKLQGLSPARHTDRYPALPIKVAPFYALPMCTGITHGMGGILIDGNSAVLDKKHEPIPHLYAAGTVTGGLDGGPAIGYVSGLTKSGVMGLRAAEKIAGAKLSSQRQ